MASQYLQSMLCDRVYPPGRRVFRHGKHGQAFKPLPYRNVLQMKHTRL